MAKYYAVNSMADIKNGLLDYYGAGITIHTDSASLLIFSCPAIADKVIKFTGYADMIASYGDAYNGGDITNPVIFGASTTGGSTTAGFMVCGGNTLLLNFLVSSVVSRLWLIGKLDNDQYAVVGMTGHVSYSANAIGKITTTNTDFYLLGMSNDYNVGSKIAISRLLLITSTGALFSDTGIISFNDVFSSSKQLGPGIVNKGTGYFMSTSGMYENFGRQLTNSIVMEVTN